MVIGQRKETKDRNAERQRGKTKNKISCPQAWEKKWHWRETRRGGDRHETYQEKLGELSVAELPVPLCAKVQPNELAVPVKGDVLVDGGLAEDLLHILCGGDKKRDEMPL